MKPLPQHLLESLKPMPGFDEEAFIHAHEQESRITSIRLNPFKASSLSFPKNEPVPWCEGAYYLNDRPSFTLDPLFHAGCYYVQEAGSMFLQYCMRSVLDFHSELRVLDLCAAPGGKSTLINSMLNAESLLVSNDVIKKRAEILSQNLSRWGSDNIIVCNSDPQKFQNLGNYFDALVVDAPCSGSGLFRKQPSAIDEWSEQLVNMCSVRQRSILAETLSALKPGGYLFYSTCSYSVEENEKIVEWLIKDQDLEYIPITLQKEWNIVESDFGYRFYPHLTRSEGFYCAILRKKEAVYRRQLAAKKPINLLKKQEFEAFFPFLGEKSANLRTINGQYHLMNQNARDFLELFGKLLYVRKAGVHAGEIKGKDLVPSQEMAWYNHTEYPRTAELNLEEALNYLRRQSFSSVGETGLNLITYRQKGLGWAKFMPNRINNYLPAELRILN